VGSTHDTLLRQEPPDSASAEPSLYPLCLRLKGEDHLSTARRSPAERRCDKFAHPQNNDGGAVGCRGGFGSPFDERNSPLQHQTVPLTKKPLTSYAQHDSLEPVRAEGAVRSNCTAPPDLPLRDIADTTSRGLRRPELLGWKLFIDGTKRECL